MSIEEMVQEIKNGNIGLKTDLYNAIHIPLERCYNKYIKYYSYKSYDIEDCQSVVWFCVENAIKNYNRDKEAKFVTLACRYIEYYIKSKVSKSFEEEKHEISISGKVSSGDEEEITILELLEDKNAQKPFGFFETNNSYGFLYDAIRKISPSEQQIIYDAYFNQSCSHKISHTDKIKILRKLRRDEGIRQYYDEFFNNA